MASARPDETIRTYPSVVDRLYNNLESGNVTIIGVSLDTLGNIAATDKGKFALEASLGKFYCCGKRNAILNKSICR